MSAALTLLVTLLAAAVVAAAAAAPLRGPLRPYPRAAVARAATRSPRATTAAVWVLLLAAAAAAAMPRLEGPASGTTVGPASESVAELEGAVRARPDDVQARLRLARAHLDAGFLGPASDQFLAVLDLEPGNAEAHAGVGLVLGLSGEPRAGLRAIDRALGLDPALPEARLFRAVLLLRGMGREAAAARELERYLAMAGDGPMGAAAARLLADLRDALDGR